MVTKIIEICKINAKIIGHEIVSQRSNEMNDELMMYFKINVSIVEKIPVTVNKM